MTLPDEGSQTDIDEHLFVTRDEFKRILAMLEIVNRESLLVSLKVTNNDNSWRQSLETVQATWVKIHTVLDGADDERS